MDSYHTLVRTTQALQIVLFHYFICVLAVEYDVRRWASGFVFFKYYCRYCLLFILCVFILCVLAVYSDTKVGEWIDVKFKFY